MDMVDSAGLEVLSERECFQLLAAVPLGRIVFTSNALPAILPVNFAMYERTVVIRTAPRSRLAIAGTDTVAAFEVDEFSQGPVRTGWSVVAIGRTSRVTDGDELAAVQRLGLRAWASGGKQFYLRLAVEIISGRRLSSRE